MDNPDLPDQVTASDDAVKVDKPSECLADWLAEVQGDGAAIPSRPEPVTLIDENGIHSLAVNADPVLMTDAKGYALDNLTNAVTMMENDLDLCGCFRLNELTRQVEVSGPLPAPWPEFTETRPFQDTDFSFLRMYFEANEYPGPAESREAVGVVAEKCRYNPVREFFEALPEWDGVPRVGRLFSVIGAADSEYNAEVAHVLLSGIVMRTYCPGVKYDFVVTLRGPQGVGKSTFCKLLACRDDWFTDSLSTIKGRDGMESLQGFLVVEVDELVAFRRATPTEVKNFVSKTCDDYRPPYGRCVQAYPRRCVLIGTTNQQTFLDDATGNRRFLPVDCGARRPEVDVFSREARAFVLACYAEILSEFRAAGTLPLTLSREMELHAEAARAGASMEHIYTGRLAAFLKDLTPGTRVTLKQLICALAPDKELTPSEEQRFAAVLRDEMQRFTEWRWSSKKARFGDEIARYWELTP